MKVKNIMFSGVMAAILMGTAGAHAAVQIASQKYVETEVAKKADKVAFETLESAVNSETDGLATKASKAELQNTQSTLQNAIDLKANIADVYTTAQADEKFQTIAKAAEDAAAATSYTNQKVQELADTLGGVDDEGQSTGLISTVNAHGTRIGDLETKVGDVSVADRIATSLANYTTTANLEANYLTKADATNTYATKTTIGDLGEFGTVVAYVGNAVETVNDNLGTTKSTAEEALGKADANADTIGTLSTDVATLQSTVGNAESGLVKGVAENAAAIAAEESRATAAEEALDGRVDTLETTVGNAESGLVKGVAENAAAITTLNGGADVVGSVDSKIKATADTLLNRPTTNTCGADSGLCVLTMSNDGALVWIDVTDPATE